MLFENLTEKRSVLSRFSRAAQQLEDVGAGGVDNGDDSSSKSSPVDDRVLLLEGDGKQRGKWVFVFLRTTWRKNVCSYCSYLSKDTKKSDGNDKSTCNITFSTLVLNITNSGTGQEHEAKDGQSDVESIRATLLNSGKGSKGVQDSNKDDESMPQWEGSMNEKTIPPVGCRVVLLQVV